VLLLACWLAYRRIDAWYARSFGRVSRIPGQFRRRELVKWLLVYPALGASLAADAIMEPPLLVSGVVWAAAVLAYWASTGRGRRHYPVAAALLAALTFVPLVGPVDRGRPAVALLIAAIGAVYVAGGVLDHRELVRLLPRAPADQRDLDGSAV
jgi:hypothetical protein